MCGIIAIRREDGRSPTKMLRKRYSFQKERGTEGYGFVMLKKGQLIAYERAETEDEIWKKLDAVEGDEVIFHHRWPTSTINVWEAAHPIKVSHPSLKHDYYLIHNGAIHSPEEYKKTHEACGFKYTTEIISGAKTATRFLRGTSDFNDSETLAIELAVDLDRDGEGINVRGSIAFVMLQTTKEGKAVRLYWGRNDSSPLKMDSLDGIYTSLCSTGSGVSINPNKLFEYTYETKTTSARDYKIGKEYEIMGYRKDHNMPVPVTEIPTRDEYYYDLLKDYDDLKKAYEKAELAGEDSTILRELLDDVEADIADLEAEMNEIDVKSITA